MSGKIGRIDVERLELYFICNDSDNEKRVPALLSLIGGNTYSLLRGLTAPAKPASLRFDAIVKILKEYFNPKPIIIAERFRFHKRDQRQGETIGEYIAEIRKLSQYCEFEGYLYDALRDRLVCGMNHEQTQRKLLSIVELTYQQAVDISIAMETAERDAGELQSKHGQNINSSAVHKVKVSGFKMKDRSRNSRGNNKSCFRCLGTNHEPQDCRWKNETCHACNKKGHIKKACRSKKVRQTVHNVQTDEEESIASLEINTMGKTNQDVIWISPIVEGVKFDMELDTGSAVSVVAEKTFQKYFPNKVKDLKPTDVSLKTYSGEKLKPVGIVSVKVEHNKQCKQLKIYVVPKGDISLFGRDWLKEINLDWHLIKMLQVSKSSNDGNTMAKVDRLVEKYKSVFQSNRGTLKDIKATLNLKTDVQPKFMKARSVPYSIKPKVEAEIEKLVSDGILTKVNYSEWATPVVPVIKQDGSVRVCGDFKVTVNPVLEVDQYPLPRIEDIFASLAGGQRFSKIDLRQAYLQMEVDEKSRDLLTVNTEKGLYRFNRLVYGIASAPAIWQRAMDTVFQGLSGVKCIIDDMIITGRSDEEHLQNLENVLQRLEKYNLRIKLEKCEFFKDRISFCGHEIDMEGLHKTQSKIEAVVKAPKPENVSQLRTFLGLVNYYNRFLKDVSTVLHPLYELLRRDKPWVWSDQCEEAFCAVKALITSPEVLTPYNPNLPIRLTCDASPVGLGAVLSHVMDDGVERQIAYASRSLTKAERNYSQIDKEALALIWGVKRFHTYLFGREFTLLTDHQPLVSMFHPRKGIPMTTAARLQRYALFLAGHNYRIEYKNTKMHGNADCLSRLPVDSGDKETVDENIDPVEVLHIAQFDTLPVSHANIQRETRNDPVLSKVHEMVITGWPEKSPDVDFDPFFHRRNELTVHQGCLLWGMRVIIPHSSRKKILEELHEGHIGVVKMKALARSHVWWPGIDKDIELLAKRYVGCQFILGNGLQNHGRESMLTLLVLS
ncbi:uncharacterized protein K02A2.6-like [Gigantopelta aegis]|uniref:uncharacterized protein K02A2.6-like n=1 Tax=Gigantopelta aegis TaxID=1735272 RepID=UPI001B88BFB9|nr:uncharacterized protein K02A2.6-like [Gigantopelta aegis]